MDFDKGISDLVNKVLLLTQTSPALSNTWSNVFLFLSRGPGAEGGCREGARAPGPGSREGARGVVPVQAPELDGPEEARPHHDLLGHRVGRVGTDCNDITFRRSI